MRSLALLGVSVLMACGPLTPPRPDAGGTGGGGNITGGGSGGGSTGGSGGGSLGGGAGGGAVGGGGGSMGGGGGAVGGGGGRAADAGDGIWDFSVMTLSPAPVNSGAIVGFAETDAGIFAVSAAGRLYRSTGGAFNQVFAFPGLQPVDFEATADGHLFIISTVHFLECDTDCADAGAWSDRQISASAEVLDSLCVVDSNHVLAVGSRGGADDGIAYRWDGTTLATNAALLGVTLPQNCWRGASGDFFIPARDTVLRYSPINEGFTPEPTMTFSGWRGGGSSPGHEWVLGVGPVIAERGQSGWTNVYAPTGTSGSVTTVVGISPTLAFAFGGGGSSTGQSGYRFDGFNWSPLTPDLPVMNVTFSAFRASNGAIYVGGYDTNVYATIVRGDRR